MKLLRNVLEYSKVVFAKKANSQNLKSSAYNKAIDTSPNTW